MPQIQLKLIKRLSPSIIIKCITFVPKNINIFKIKQIFYKFLNNFSISSKNLKIFVKLQQQQNFTFILNYLEIINKIEFLSITRTVTVGTHPYIMMTLFIILVSFGCWFYEINHKNWCYSCCC